MEQKEKYVGLTECGLLYAKLHFDYHIPSFIASFIAEIIIKIKKK